MDNYGTNVAKIKYKKTRRGIDAKAPLVKKSDGVTFATLDDEATAMVALITYLKPEYRADFEEAALEWGADKYPWDMSESYIISEFARKAVMDDEQKSLDEAEKK